jgi:hypothetical protein
MAHKGCACGEGDGTFVWRFYAFRESSKEHSVCMGETLARGEAEPLSDLKYSHILPLQLDRNLIPAHPPLLFYIILSFFYVYFHWMQMIQSLSDTTSIDSSRPPDHDLFPGGFYRLGSEGA